MVSAKLLRQAILDSLGNHPTAFAVAYSALGKKRGLVASSATDIVIEGFPRSGNTFAVVAFELAQGTRSNLRIAHHLHVPAQLALAQRHDLPALVIVREPRANIPSLVVREPHISIARALRKYGAFHRAILQYRKSLFIANFADVITDFGRVIEQFNNRYGTNFVCFDHTAANVQNVFTRIEEFERGPRDGDILEDKVARPSATRSEAKKRILVELQQAPYREPLAKCEQLYAGIIHQRVE